MLNQFRNWYYHYNTEITWFIIGWLALNTVHDVSRGDWLGVIISIVLILINYLFWRR
jgi:hypothetical protein